MRVASGIVSGGDTRPGEAGPRKSTMVSAASRGPNHDRRRHHRDFGDAVSAGRSGTRLLAAEPALDREELLPTAVALGLKADLAEREEQLGAPGLPARRVDDRRRRAGHPDHPAGYVP